MWNRVASWAHPSYLIFARCDSTVSMLRVILCCSRSRVPLKTCVSPIIDCSQRYSRSPHIFHQSPHSATIKYRSGYRGKHDIVHSKKPSRILLNNIKWEEAPTHYGASSRNRALEVDISTPRSTKAQPQFSIVCLARDINNTRESGT